MSEIIIELADIHKSYSTGMSGTLEVLRGITLGIRPGAVLAITGSSGAGKSTLLHIMGALDRPSSGSLFFNGRDVFTLGDQELAQFRSRNMGFVFQFHHLLPEFTAVENVAMPALIAGENHQRALDRAMELLELVNVQHRAGARPSELSGGEQQRVAVARALVNSPGIVLADEPSGNLDEENAELLHDLLFHLAGEKMQTLVLVTHDNDLARRADAVYRLHDGQLFLRDGNEQTDNRMLKR